MLIFTVVAEIEIGDISLMNKGIVAEFSAIKIPR